MQIISTSTACDAESRTPCDSWGEVVPTVLKRVWCSSLLITADPGHPGAELRCCFISGRSGYWIFKRDKKILRSPRKVVCFVRQRKFTCVIVHHGSSREFSAAGRGEPGGWVSSVRRGAERDPGGRRRPGEQGTARPQSTFEIFVNLVTNRVSYTLHLSIFLSSPPLSRSSAGTYHAQCV